MAGKILRLKDLIHHTGLSRTVIYDRMDEKSPRYAKDFPKSFNLDGGAIGWFQSEVDAWLENCAANAKRGTKTKTSKPSPNAQTPEVATTAIPSALPKSTTPSRKPSKTPPSTPKPVATLLPTPTKRSTRPSNLAEAIVEGGRINARIQDFLQMKEWTPAMGAMLVAGIEPPLDCNEIPEGGMGLDEVELHTSNDRFHQARRILKDWHEWKDDAHDPVVNMEPNRYLNWCLDEGNDTEWFRLLLELAGKSEIGAVDLTASRFALLTNR